MGNKRLVLLLVIIENIKFNLKNMFLCLYVNVFVSRLCSGYLLKYLFSGIYWINM